MPTWTPTYLFYRGFVFVSSSKVLSFAISRLSGAAPSVHAAWPTNRPHARTYASQFLTALLDAKPFRFELQVVQSGVPSAIELLPPLSQQPQHQQGALHAAGFWPHHQALLRAGLHASGSSRASRTLSAESPTRRYEFIPPRRRTIKGEHHRLVRCQLLAGDGALPWYHHPTPRTAQERAVACRLAALLRRIGCSYAC